MSSINFSFATSGYRVPALELSATTCQVYADFEDGDHVFTSSDLQLGTVRYHGGQSLVGRLTFRYSYDASTQKITVCGTDYASADGMTLATAPQGSNAICLSRAADSGFAADEYTGGAWNHSIQLPPGAAAIFKDTARDANNAMITALKTQSHLTVQVRKTLSKLPLDLFHNLCTVYRDGQFLELFNPATNDPDPKIGGLTWIRLWAGEYGYYPTVCTSLNFAPITCDSNMNGGHVILGTVARAMATGSNSVYILPICTPHNTNDSVYMAAITNRHGVWLRNYMAR